uniref:EOG090X02SD n=1 Tax=Scapholeberis mucronata TaxID=202097 RepID=A0A4Y7NLN4_9CRUS|nr:EOG090X02SD [Scapholeberis mucronata]
MNLLPKSSSEFSQQDYWDKFFKTRGKKAFEWYGTYHQLCGVLHKYINPRDHILIGGCGNSTLGADLYSAGFTSITNVDISDTVIQQMNSQYNDTHPLMKFVSMDLLQMTFPDESFTCFLDKGTLDALMSGSDEDSKERALQLFKEVDRVLKVGGRYVCISLLQSHILEFLTSFFHNLGWMIRICRCEEAEHQEENANSKSKKNSKSSKRSPFPVFAIICTKFKKMERIKPLLEFSPSETTIDRLSSVEELNERIQSIQHFATLCHRMNHDNKTSEDNNIELMDPNSTKKTPKYTIFIVDRQAKSNNKFAAFVVPQGREIDWMFSSNEGRRQLADNAKYQRLLVIHLGRDHHFPNLEYVQTELSGVVSSLQPEGLEPNTQIPFLSLGSEVNQRKEIHRGVSDSTGEYVVEEVEEDQHGKSVTLRRLIFLSSPNLIQSEARIQQGKVDLKYLSCRHHLVMIEALRQHLDNFKPNFQNFLVLGLGGGALCSYIYQAFPKLKVDGVDIDPTMVDLAKKYFGFPSNDRLTAHIADGVTFVNDSVASDTQYSCIMLDVDCKDRSLGISCPPPSFLEPSFVQSIKKCLSADGLFLMNLVCRNETMRTSVTDILHETFASVITKKIKDEVNQVLVCHSLESSSKGRKASKN